MPVDVLKKLKKEAQARQEKRQWQPKAAPAASKAAPVRAFEPAHKYFVSNNWKNLLDRKPTIAPKTASKVTLAAAAEELAEKNLVAMDCEMVGVGTGGTRSALARVSIVDSEGVVLMDRFVKPDEPITDYRTHITGITAERLTRKDVMKPEAAKEQAAALMEGKLVVGHALQNDFQVLELSHPHALIRDTAIFKPLRLPDFQKKTPSLARLSEHWLQERIHEGQHNSIQDARMALRLYRLKSREWERMMKSAMAVRPGSAGITQDEEEGEPVARDAAPQGKRQKKKAAAKKRQEGKGIAGTGNARESSPEPESRKRKAAQKEAPAEDPVPDLGKNPGKKKRKKLKAAAA